MLLGAGYHVEWVQNTEGYKMQKTMTTEGESGTRERRLGRNTRDDQEKN